MIKNIEDLRSASNKTQLADTLNEIKNKINRKHMENGVILLDPSSVYIDSDVEIGLGTIIYPGVILENKTVIGENCIIGPNTRIINSTVKNNVTIDSSKVIESFINDNTSVGPFAYLRPGTKLGKNVKIGDFVELKNSSVDDGSKASHLAYIGDAEIGKDVNIGCAVVFVNYDGKNKNKTIIKDGAFIGSNSNLVAPVTIEESAYIACGSTITDDVEKDALAIARARQVNKPGRGAGRY